MAIEKFSPLLAENPLCGIGEYKDALDLSTGGVTRQIKKLVLTGEESGLELSNNIVFALPFTGIISGYYPSLCDRYVFKDTYNDVYRNDGTFAISNSRLLIHDSNYSTTDGFKSFLAAQYDNGTPVTVWYVLATPETETITVPSGLTGTIEGYLTQSGIPTPSEPIYPEANQALVWVPTNYRKYGTETEIITSLPKEIITDGESIPSANLAHFEKGGISSSNGMDSAWTADRAQLRSQYIACEPESSYTISLGAYPAQNFTAFYDSHYSYLERTQGTSIESDRVITAPQNASFMRVTLYHNAEEQIYPSEEEGFTAMVNEGSSAMPYVPYTGCIISGNMNQNGTPTPDSPIYPEECGEMSENLFNVTTVEKGRINDGDVVYQSDTTSLTIEGDTVTYTTNARYRGVCSGFIEIPDGAEYLCWSGVFSGGDGIAKRIIYYNSTKTWLNADSSTPSSENSGRQQIPVNAKYVRFSFTSQGIGEASISNMMVSTGYNALPYEPYGYKLPLFCGGVTTNTYLGETQSTRKIKKLVFDGTGDWTYSVSGTKKRVFFRGFDRAGISLALCSHFINTDYTAYPDDGYFAVNNASATHSMIFGISDMQVSDVTGWTQFLADQYANGTPVTIWYVLETPSTAILNEPIRKIYDYADTALATRFPTTGTPENFDVLTTTKPSEVSLTYHGWHEHEDTKYTE